VINNMDADAFKVLTFRTKELCDLNSQNKEDE